MHHNKVSVIIAARNEAPRIARVLKVASVHPLVGEVIVICDGCTDNTAEIAATFHAKVHTKVDSQGKTLAIRSGIKLAKYDTVLLLDADLKGLTEQNITDLVTPVLSGKVDWTLSIRGNSSHIYKIFQMDFVSGERTVRKELLHDREIWCKPKIGYGLEVLMNDSLLKRGKTFVSVELPNLYATPKSEKMSYWQGVMADLKMVYNIFRAFPFYLTGLQFVNMVILNNRYRRHLNKFGYEKTSI
jgi:glycosyltransferase involved in cell wall biosynthesis